MKNLFLLLFTLLSFSGYTQTRYFLNWDSQNTNDFVLIKKNGVYIGDDATDSDICMWANNADANEPYLCYDASSNSWVYSNDGLSQSLIGSGSGGSGINYIDNNDIGQDTTGFNTYADAAGTEPVDGTGGSSSVGVFRSTNSVYGLRDLDKNGTADGLTINKSASNLQGQGVSYDFTTDVADQNAILRVSFSYYTSANYVDDDIRLFVYDKDSSNLIRVISGENIKTNEYGEHVAYFQSTAADDYRLIWHIATTNANLYVVAIDNIQVGPVSDKGIGSFVTDQTSFSTAVGTWVEGTSSNPTYGTTTLNKGYYSRVGDKIHLEWYLRQTGAGSAGTGSYLFTLPDGLAFDTTKISGGGTPSLNTSFSIDNGSQVGFGHVVLESGSSTQFRVITMTTSGTRAEFGASGFPLSNASLNLKMTLIAPIAGWETGIRANEIGSNRACVVEGAGNGGAALTTAVTNIDWTETRDDCAAWDGDEYTAKESGDYSFSGGTIYTTNATDRFIQLYKDTGSGYSLVKNLSHRSGFSQDIHSFSGRIYLNKGDKIAFRSVHTVATTLSNSTNYHHINIRKINNLYGVVQPSEKIYAHYTTSTATAFNSTADQITLEDKITDSHNAMSSSTYTIPRSGPCSLVFSVRGNAETYTAGNNFGVSIYKNGSVYTQDFVWPPSGTFGLQAKVTADEYFEKGDQLTFRAFSSVATNVETSSAGNYNYFKIVCY